MLSTDSISNIRALVFGLTGLVCLGYALLVLATGQSEPIPFWIPGVCGVLAAAILVISSRAAGQKAAKSAWDEGYQFDAQRAAAISFWVALMIYPLFGVLNAMNIIGGDMMFAVMGLLTGATYLLLVTWFDFRGRG